MATIAISLAGEGRGHATRVKTVVEMLRREHRVILFASSVAYDLLAAAYRDLSGVGVQRIPGLHFCYRGQRLDYLRSVCQAGPFLWKLRPNVRRIEEALRDEGVDLAITDFEPLLPRAAERCGVPYLSFDHQHFLVANDLRDLPWYLRWKASFLRLPMGLFYRRQMQTIISSFYAPPLKPAYADAVQVGVLVRPEILAAEPIVGRHLLVYMRRFLPEPLRRTLEASGREVRIYGLGGPAEDGNLRFLPVDEQGFLEDLRTCDAVIASAGNQLVGEALYLRKPFLALPEPGNFEQAINAHFVRASGCGDWMDCSRMAPSDLLGFLNKTADYRRQICPERYVGNERAFAAIGDVLRRISRKPLAPAQPQAA